ncbi:MAG: T9SS type A sorting domain-containing protein [Flavobacteriales bacterium]|nr:T9SS type A sorting domain-containing protein [Flavobacteriales bacterium]
MRKSILKMFFATAAVAWTAQASAQIVVLAEAPASVEGSYNYTTTGGWGADLAGVTITAQAVLFHSDAATDTLACGVANNASELSGKIAFLYRGTCEFGAKSLNAQNAGAIAVVIVNNAPGDPIDMGGGAVGAQVTIPVVMISDIDGALLRPYVDSGELELFIGNKTGLFAFDAGFQKPDVAMAKSFATPVQFAETNTDFFVPVAAWVRNYGSENQTGAALNAVITLDGDELYNESSAAEAIPSGDSILVSLPDFAPANYSEGLYTLTYTISTGSEDEFPNDNSRVVTFWINSEGLYSKTRIDSETNAPVAGGGLRPSDSPEYMWCTMLRSENASSMKIDAVSFSTITNEGLGLDGQAVFVEVYEWNDPFDETTTELTFTDLTQIGEVFYDYPADSTEAAALQSQFVTAEFDTPVLLDDNIKYLVCTTIFVDNMFLRVDGGIDYGLTYNAYPLEVFFPVNSGGEWFPGGFGTDNAPAIITHLSLATGIAEEMESSAAKAYPNPTTDYVTIPLGHSVEGNVMLNVFDMAGREVMSQNISNTAGGQLRVDASGLTNGTHVFRLMFEDQTTTSFRVVVKK